MITPAIASKLLFPGDINPIPRLDPMGSDRKASSQNLHLDLFQCGGQERGMGQVPKVPSG